MKIKNLVNPAIIQEILINHDLVMEIRHFLKYEVYAPKTSLHDFNSPYVTTVIIRAYGNTSEEFGIGTSITSRTDIPNRKIGNHIAIIRALRNMKRNSMDVPEVRESLAYLQERFPGLV